MRLTTLSIIAAAIFSIAELFIISKPGYNNAWAMNADGHGH